MSRLGIANTASQTSRGKRIMLHQSGGLSEPNWLWRDLPGIALCALIACAATWTALLAGSAVVWGLIFGLVLAAIWSPPSLFQTGISFAARHVIRIGVALLGFQISLATLQILNVADVVALAINVAIVLAVGWFAGPMLGITRELSLVAAASVAICGASAAAAVACVVMRNDSANRDVACTIGVVSIISSAAMILYPLLVHMAGLDSAAGGIFLGGSIHEVAHAVAAGYSVNPETGEMATVAKLLRVALLAPVCIAVSFIASGRGCFAKAVVAVAAGFFGRFCLGCVAQCLGVCPARAVSGDHAALALLSRHVDGGNRIDITLEKHPCLRPEANHAPVDSFRDLDRVVVDLRQVSFVLMKSAKN
ncbi:putative integral membrane protein (TIGR00698 family) [Bradyrhizobium sp. AZCC 1719]